MGSCPDTDIDPSFGCPELCLTNKSVLGNFDGLSRMPHEI